MLVTCQEMAKAEERLFSSGVDAEPFMDEAGRKCAEAIRVFHPNAARVEVFCGKGNNGGDALVISKWLKRWGYDVHLHFSHGRNRISRLAKRKLLEFEKKENVSSREILDGGLLVVDGLLGIGATGPLRGEIRKCADEMNRLRNEHFATCFSVDIPTGLNADTGVPGEGAVVADYTLSITAPKIGFSSDESIDTVGRLVEIPLAIPVEGERRDVRFLFPSNLRPRLRRRNFDAHKGKAGRVAVVAGSSGMTGAAALTALGASRSGAGLVTVFAEEEVYPIIASQCPLEVMVRPMESIDEVSSIGADVIAIGPGLSDRAKKYVDFIFSAKEPMIVDADALNALAESGGTLAHLPKNRLLTPHPGELARLVSVNGSRIEQTREIADRWGITLLYKGARTAVATPGEPVELNTTGHPGMASGGMGDVLTGICASLVGQGYSLHDSACLGSWLLGRAAEIAASPQTEIASEGISAPHVAEFLPHALRTLQKGLH